VGENLLEGAMGSTLVSQWGLFSPTRNYQNGQENPLDARIEVWAPRILRFPNKPLDTQRTFIEVAPGRMILRNNMPTTSVGMPPGYWSKAAFFPARSFLPTSRIFSMIRSVNS